jgi:DNA polymerase-4
MKKVAEKAILHLDADSFFASVEIAKNPKLRGKAVVTGKERGIATSMSQEAKTIGITRGMPVFKIRKFFPQVVIVHSDYESYALYSNRIFNIVRRYTGRVEEYSIDECFADLSGADKAFKCSYIELIAKIQRDIDIELNISVSLGIGPTKVLAKIGSKYNKPHGLTVIETPKISEFLRNVPVGRVWGIGYRTVKILHNKGIKTAYDFATLAENYLDQFANKPLKEIWYELNGTAVYGVNDGPEEMPQSISKTKTFHPNTNDPKILLSELSRNVENACVKARLSHVVAKHVVWYIKSSEMKHYACELSTSKHTNIPTDIFPLIRNQFAKIFNPKYMYRATGVTLYNIRDENIIQKGLFEEGDNGEKNSLIYSVVDDLREKYGRHVVSLASSLHAHKNESREYELAHSQAAILKHFNREGKELSIAYLGEVS